MKHAKWISCLSLLTVTTGAALGVYYYHQSPHVILTKSTFQQLPNWQKDDLTPSLIAFKQSCTEILKRPAQEAFSSLASSGKNQDWQAACLAAQPLKPNAMTARHFFETWFEPYRVSNNFQFNGLFTGYYLPLIQGRLKPNKEFSIPIHGVPDDLVKINLGLFRRELAGKIIIGQVKQNQFFPYPDRAAITQGAINKQARTLAWGNNKLDIFFAQIQGSALLQLPNQQRFLLSYASNNGHAYTAIGKVLVENKSLSKQSVSLQSIYSWLNNHPEQIDAVLNRNASYVFFTLSKNTDAVGAEQVPLTPERSLAIDTHYIPLGAPVWLDTTLPSSQTRFQHLLIAQDTGGAIKGVVRGDVYWGSGEKARWIAGQMQEQGQYWVLMPRKI